MRIQHSCHQIIFPYLPSKQQSYLLWKSQCFDSSTISPSTFLLKTIRQFAETLRIAPMPASSISFVLTRFLVRPFITILPKSCYQQLRTAKHIQRTHNPNNLYFQFTEVFFGITFFGLNFKSRNLAAQSIGKPEKWLNITTQEIGRGNGIHRQPLLRRQYSPYVCIPLFSHYHNS